MDLKKTMSKLFAQNNGPGISPVLMPDTFPREDRLATFVTQLRTGWSYAANKAEVEAVIDFVTTDQTYQPVISAVWYYADIFTLLHDNPDYWTGYDDRLMQFVTQKSYWEKGSYDGFCYYFYHHWLQDKLTEYPDRPFFETLTNRLVQYGISEPEVVEQLCAVASHFFIVGDKLSGIGEYVIGRVDRLFSSIHKTSDLVPLLKLLLRYAPTIADKNLTRLLQVSDPHADDYFVNATCVRILLETDARKYEPVVAALLPKLTDHNNLSAVLDTLTDLVPTKYGGQDLDHTYRYFDRMREQLRKASSHNHYGADYDPRLQKYVPVYLNRLQRLLDLEEPATARKYLLTWLTDAPYFPIDILPPIVNRLGQASVELLMTALKTETGPVNRHVSYYYKTFFQLLSTLDYSAYYPQIWAFTRHPSKQMREMAAVTLAKLGDTAIPEAEKLLNDKKADARQIGTLLLSLIRTDHALTLLRAALASERNDDARDLMLDSLAGLLPVPTTEADALAIVEQTRQRGKLDEPLTAWLTESAFPALHWRASGQPLGTDALRFLLYRMSRTKDIRPDAEARPLLSLIDRDRSGPFAKALLRAYADSGADPKFKGFLTLGAMLGGDDAADFLRASVNQWVETGRGKMAEYAVQALALVGSNKALRAVEFFARKYKSKNKNVGAAANEAFGIAAETLGITPYELADAVIPDFGFTGLFRVFDVNGETYRAFVDNDFKLAFLADDNRLVKALPKATPAELKEEFKAIGKEIRDIVKSQSGRLEQYLVIQRKWSANAWQDFFGTNPVMFAYAVRLIWGAYDDRQTLLFTFRCQEDQTLVNTDGDEIALDAQLIGMVHPLSLTPDQVAYWTDQLADADIEPIFSQLNRRVVALPDEQRGLTMDSQFQGVEMGGYGFISKLEKLGWVRGSVQDAGWIASYYKDFSELGITAIIMQEGDLGIGYYDGTAALGRVMFVRSGSVQFGNYRYDEPGKDTDPRLIPFGTVPPIVYSEVMADMQYFKENDTRTQK